MESEILHLLFKRMDKLNAFNTAAIATVLFIVCIPVAGAQSSSFIDWSGYVKTDLFWDTRNTVSFRENHFELYPERKIYNENGEDINKNLQFNILSIQTRLIANINIPDAFGATASGIIESAFFGSAESNINTLRLRHAYLNLDWEKSSLLVGQFWHPLFVTQSYPGTVALTTGAPFQAFSRNPQIRFTVDVHSFQMILAALSQRDFSGPGGATSLQNSAIPNLHAQVQLQLGNHRLGTGLDYKRISINPQLYNSVDSFSLFGFSNSKFGAIMNKAYMILGNNMMDQTMIGGVAMNQTTQKLEPTRTLSIWNEITSGFLREERSVQVEVAAFLGYSKNLGIKGSDVNYIENFFRGSDIDYLYRVAPRVQVQSGRARISFELDVTSAAYDEIKSDGITFESHSAVNTRFLTAFWLFF